MQQQTFRFDSPMPPNSPRVDGAKIKKLRISHGWSQEQLATIASISPRTVQRAENGNASLETLQGLASAFDTNVNALFAPEKSDREKREEVCDFLVRLQTGGTLARVLYGRHAHSIDNDELQGETELQAVSGFFQELDDSDLFLDDLGAGERVKYEYHLAELIQELEGLGLWVFGAVIKRPVRYADGTTGAWNVAAVSVLHANNPTIIKVPLDKESVPRSAKRRSACEQCEKLC